MTFQTQNVEVNDNKIWDEISSIDELKHCNIEFIKGKIKATPYYHGPLTPDSVKLKDQLITLNELGFITTGGQGSLNEETILDQSNTTEKENIGMYYCEQQKPCVEGFMNKLLADKIVEKIKNEKPFIKYSFTAKNKKNISNFGDFSMVFFGKISVITRYKLYKNKEEKEKWEETTTMLPYSKYEMVIEDHYFNDNINNILENDYCYASFVIDDYGSPIIIEDHLIEIIKNIRNEQDLTY